MTQPDDAGNREVTVKRCPGCGDTLHWLGAGYGHDSDNMACCMRLYWEGKGRHTASELLDREADAMALGAIR